jgi:hypothetical protein
VGSHLLVLTGVEAYDETQHPRSLSRIFGFHKTAGFHSLRGSTQPTRLTSDQYPRIQAITVKAKKARLKILVTMRITRMTPR